MPGHTGGESETIIGDWTKTRGNRDSAVIATKVGSHPQFRGLTAKTQLGPLLAAAALNLTADEIHALDHASAKA